MAAKLSVIIPAYNVQAHVQRCLESLCAQSFGDFEAIVVDDGSTDGTGAILDRFAREDGRFRVVHTENRGVSEARNAGIALAKGEYFLFFDADDFSEPETLEELYALAVEKEADTVIYGYHRYSEGKTVETNLPIFPEGLYENEEILTRLASRFVGFSCLGIRRWLGREEKGLYVENPALWRTMVSGDIVRRNGLRFDKNLKVGEDTVFITLYLSYARRCLVHHKCYYYLVLHEGSTIARYEKNPAAKLEGKERLLTARQGLTADIRARTGVDIAPYWQGTVVMSCIELAFLLSGKSRGMGLWAGYRAFLRYAKQQDVQAACRRFAPGKGGGLLAIPFRLLRRRLYLPLFLGAWGLNLGGYRFQRG